MREETSLVSSPFCGLRLECRVCGDLSMGMELMEVGKV